MRLFPTVKVSKLSVFNSLTEGTTVRILPMRSLWFALLQI